MEDNFVSRKPSRDECEYMLHMFIVATIERLLRIVDTGITLDEVMDYESVNGEDITLEAARKIVLERSR